MSEKKEAILKGIEDKTIKIGIIGLGYVGLPLAIAFLRSGYRVFGFEVDREKRELLDRGRSYVADVADDELAQAVESGAFTSTDNSRVLRECNAIIICVPTPLDKFGKPDMTYIENACKEVGENLSAGTLVSLESTTYPTTTEEFMLPIIEGESQLKEGADFWVCYSPERVDPGNQHFRTHNTPKIVAGLGIDAQEVALALYGQAVESVYPVSSPRVAEMAKILENTYRLVNISLINEMALLSGRMGIDIWEVIEAAKSKPYGFQPFYPGPGIGGHCIPLDPFYLEYVAKKYSFDLTMIHTAGHINMMMPHRMTIKINSALNRHQKSINGSKIIFMGVAYKPNVADSRESPAIKIMDEIADKGGKVKFHDSYVPSIKTPKLGVQNSVELSSQLLSEQDCVVIATRHSNLDIGFVLENSRLVVDLANAVPVGTDTVYKL